MVEQYRCNYKQQNHSKPLLCDFKLEQSVQNLTSVSPTCSISLWWLFLLMFGWLSQLLALPQSFYCLVSRLPLPITAMVEAPAMHSDSAINALHQCSERWPTICPCFLPIVSLHGLSGGDFGCTWSWTRTIANVSQGHGNPHQETLLPQKGAKSCRWWMWYGCLGRKVKRAVLHNVIISLSCFFL